MSISHVQGTGGFSSGSVANFTQTFGSAVTAGDLVIVGINSTAAVSSVTDNFGNTYTQIKTTNSSGQFIYAYYAIITTGGSGFAVKYTPTTSGFITLAIDEYSAAGGTWTLAGSSVATGTSTTVSPGAIAFAGNALDYGLAALTTVALALTPDGGYTGRYGVQFSTGVSLALQAEDQLNDSSGSANPGFTISTSHAWMSIGAVFTATAGASFQPWIFGDQIESNGIG